MKMLNMELLWHIQHRGSRAARGQRSNHVPQTMEGISSNFTKVKHDKKVSHLHLVYEPMPKVKDTIRSVRI